MANLEYTQRVRTLLHIIIDKSYSANCSNEFRTNVRQSLEAINEILKDSTGRVENLKIAITYVGETLEYHSFMHRDSISTKYDIVPTSTRINDAIISGTMNLIHEYDCIKKLYPVEGNMFIFANNYDDASLYSLDDAYDIIRKAEEKRRIKICISKCENEDFWKHELSIISKKLNEKHEISRILFM